MIHKNMDHSAAFLLVLAMLGACTPSQNPSEENKPDPLPELPAPSEEIKESNVFVIDFFSTLEDDADFFISRDAGVASEYIQAQSGKRSLVYMFDRADYQIGREHAATTIAYNVGAFPYFAQSGSAKAEIIPGTAMVTRYPISDYDGIAKDGVYLSGCTIQLPIALTDKLCIATSFIADETVAEAIFTEKKVRLLSNMMIVGTVPADAANKVQKYFESMSLRVCTLGSTDSAKDLIVVLPASYVCRNIESGKKVNLPYYRIFVEKWM